MAGPCGPHGCCSFTRGSVPWREFFLWPVMMIRYHPSQGYKYNKYLWNLSLVVMMILVVPFQCWTDSSWVWRVSVFQWCCFWHLHLVWFASTQEDPGEAYPLDASVSAFCSIILYYYCNHNNHHMIMMPISCWFWRGLVFGFNPYPPTFSRTTSTKNVYYPRNLHSSKTTNVMTLILLIKISFKTCKRDSRNEMLPFGASVDDWRKLMVQQRKRNSQKACSTEQLSKNLEI